MTAELVIRATHAPAPQGSMFAQCTVDRRHRAIAIPDNKATTPWRKAIVTAAETAMRAVEWLPLNEAIEVHVIFLLTRPPSVKPSKRPYPSTRPDLDKLARSTLDALADAGVFAEDGRVVDLVLRKRYCDPGQAPGARIVVRALAAQLAVLDVS